jgi:hypothetical protein
MMIIVITIVMMIVTKVNTYMESEYICVYVYDIFICVYVHR